MPVRNTHRAEVPVGRLFLLPALAQTASAFRTLESALFLFRGSVAVHPRRLDDAAGPVPLPSSSAGPVAVTPCRRSQFPLPFERILSSALLGREHCRYRDLPPFARKRVAAAHFLIDVQFSALIFSSS